MLTYRLLTGPSSGSYAILCKAHCPNRSMHFQMLHTYCVIGRLKYSSGKPHSGLCMLSITRTDCCMCCAGCRSWSWISAIYRADSHNTHRLSVLWCGLCQKPVWSEHHPQRRVHGECLACLLQRHQDWQDPGAQVQLASQKGRTILSRLAVLVMQGLW